MLNFKMWQLEDLEKKLVSCFFSAHITVQRAPFKAWTNQDPCTLWLEGWMDAAPVFLLQNPGRCVWVPAQCGLIILILILGKGNMPSLSSRWQYFPQLPSQSCTELAEWRRSILNLLALHFRFWWSVPLQLQFMTQLQSSLQWQISPLLLHCTKKNILWTLCIPPRGDFHTKIICLVYFHTFLL